MTAQEERVIGALKRLRSGVRHISIGKAYTGKYDDSTGGLYKDPAYGLGTGYIWVRREGSRHAVRALNTNGRAPLNKVNVSVIVGERVNGAELEVLDADWLTGIDQFGENVYNAYQDNTIVRNRDIEDGRVYLASGGTLTFRARPFLYTDSNGDRREWPDAITGTVTASVTAASGEHQLIIIALDTDAATPALTTVNDTAVNASTPLTRADAAAVVLPDGYLPLAAIHVYNGDTTVRGDDHIWDLRPWYEGSGSAGNGLIKVSATDTTPDYLFPKLEAGANVTLTQTNVGGNETIEIAAGGGLTQTAIRDRIGTATYKTKMARQELQTLAAGGTLTLADITGSSGLVTTIWLTLNGSAVHKDAVVRVTVDGEASPSIQFDLGTMGVHFATGTGVYWTEHVGVEVDAPGLRTVLVFKFPIPFGTSCKVDLYNPTGTASLAVFSQVFYTTDITDSRRLKSASVTYRNKETISAGGAHTFLTVTDTPGCLVWHSLVAVGASNNYFLESDVNLTVDGALAISSTGTEDWFMAGWYYAAGARSAPWAFCSLINLTSHQSVQALDLLELLGGVTFTDSLSVAWDCSESTTNVDISYALLYYEGEPGTSDTLVDGTGAVGNVPYWSDADTLGDSGVAYTDLRDATKVQGRAVASSVPADGQALLWNAANNRYEPGDVAVDAFQSEPLTFNGEILFLDGDVLMIGV